MEVVEDLRVDEERDIEYDGSRERGRPVGLLPGDDEGEREEEKQEEHEAEEAEMTDEAYYGVEMIERAHRRYLRPMAAERAMLRKANRCAHCTDDETLSK